MKFGFSKAAFAVLAAALLLASCGGAKFSSCKTDAQKLKALGKVCQKYESVKTVQECKKYVYDAESYTALLEKHVGAVQGAKLKFTFDEIKAVDTPKNIANKIASVFKGAAAESPEMQQCYRVTGTASGKNASGESVSEKRTWVLIIEDDQPKIEVVSTSVYNL